MVANVVKFNGKSEIEAKSLSMLLRDIVQNLSEAGSTAKLIGDRETQYIISIALEAAREKLFLNYYEHG